MTLVEYEWAIRCDDAPFWTHCVESPQLLAPPSARGVTPRRTLRVSFLADASLTATVARELKPKLISLRSRAKQPPYRQSNAFGRARVSRWVSGIADRGREPSRCLSRDGRCSSITR